jgi:hypothetical protein
LPGAACCTLLKLSNSLLMSSTNTATGRWVTRVQKINLYATPKCHDSIPPYN